MNVPTSNFTRNVLIILSTVFMILGIGWTASNTIGGKANAEDVLEIARQVSDIENTYVTKEEAYRMERKIDRLLINHGINPESIL